jgi:hypothetical protein
MANYGAYVRTNYFKVNDVDEMKRFCQENGLRFWQEDNEENLKERYAFGTEEDGGIDIDEMIPQIQKFLYDKDVCVITEIGHEELRYLVAISYIIKKNAFSYINHMDEVKNNIISRKNEFPIEIRKNLKFEF